MFACVTYLLFGKFLYARDYTIDITTQYCLQSDDGKNANESVFCS